MTSTMEISPASKVLRRRAADGHDVSLVESNRPGHAASDEPRHLAAGGLSVASGGREGFVRDRSLEEDGLDPAVRIDRPGR